MTVSGENFEFDGVVADVQRRDVDNHLPLVCAIGNRQKFMNVAFANQKYL